MQPTVSQLSSRSWLLFFLASLTAALWIGWCWSFPQVALAGAPVGVLLIVISNGIILYGLWQALSRTDFGAGERAAVWLAIAIPLCLWIATIWVLAERGTFRPGSGANRIFPALPIAIFLPVVVGIGVLTSSKRMASLLDRTPASWLVGLQVYRVLGGIFLVNWVQGTIPGAFAVPAGIGDIAVGLLALPAAVWVSSGRPIGRKIGIWWNLLGLADFVVAIAMGMTTSPGRFQVFAHEHPNAQLGTFPTVMIPAFAVPNSIILHALSLWQLRRPLPLRE